jgi:hypothetical protein
MRPARPRSTARRSASAGGGSSGNCGAAKGEEGSVMRQDGGTTRAATLGGAEKQVERRGADALAWEHGAVAKW